MSALAGINASHTPLEGLNELEILKIGTRDSVLALKQTHHVRDELCRLHPGITCDIASMKTLGDKILDVALSKIGSKSLFTKELEEALAQQCVHLVVHSLKDLPTSLPPGMVIGAVLEREDPRDAVLLHPRYRTNGRKLADLPNGALLGSSSVRRVAQLSRHYPGLRCESVRGNLNTRLRKLEQDQHYDGLVLAAAGIHRMGWKDKVAQYLEPSECMYAVGQGALAVECLASDTRTLSLLQPLCHQHTLLAAVAERALMAALEGGCSAPVAVDSQLSDASMTLRGGVWSLDGKEELVKELTIQLPDSGPIASSDCDQASSPSGTSNSSSAFHSSADSQGIGAENKSNGRDSVVAITVPTAVTTGAGSPCSSAAAVAAETLHCASNGSSHCISNGKKRTLPQEGNTKRTKLESSSDTGSLSTADSSFDSESSALGLSSSECERDHPVPTGTVLPDRRRDCLASADDRSSDRSQSSVSFSGIVPPPSLVARAAAAHRLGSDLAKLLLSLGAARILAEAKAQNTVLAPNVKPVSLASSDAAEADKSGVDVALVNEQKQR